MKRLCLFLLLMALAGLLTSPTAAQDSGWRVESVRPMADILRPVTDTPPHMIYLAPDGRHVVFEQHSDSEQAVCSLDVVSGDLRCVSLPPEAAYDIRVDTLFPPVTWSPDATRVALVGLALLYYRDTDLGVADFSDQSLSVLAEDEYLGRIFLEPDAEGATIEVQPAWSPDGTQIAVERTRVGAEGRAEASQVVVFDTATGEARELTFLPGHEAYEVDAGTVVGLDWSPDGTTLAAALRHPSLEPLYDGIWLIDVATGKLTPLVRIGAALEAMQALYPGDEEILAATPVTWSPDGTRLLFWAGDAGAYNGHSWAFWVEIATGEIHPVSLPSSPDDTAVLRMTWPSNAVWSPDGSALLVATRELSAPDFEQAPLLYGDETNPMTGLYVIDVSTGEYTLLGYLPIQPANLCEAAWGADGDVIIGGYSLKLLRE